MAGEKEEVSIAFVNCAGGARGENCDPFKLGWTFKEALDKIQKMNLIAVGLSETMLSYKQDEFNVKFSKAGQLGQPVNIPLYETHPPLTDYLLQDHVQFRRGLGGVWFTYYLSHINSGDNHSAAAMNRKWKGNKAVPRFRRQFDIHGDNLVIHHGNAVLLKEKPMDFLGVLGVLLRPAGQSNLENGLNDPLAFKGDRDTEPRTMIMTCINVFGKKVYLAFCQLETHTKDGENREKPEKVYHNPGPANRKNQIKKICKHFEDMGNPDHPVILVGDFNARPGTGELEELKKQGFDQIFPKGYNNSNCDVYTHLK
ncbi:MAG: hypothetical protein JSV88_22935, partial [Candidatus Aminicenantes bacterium]